MKAQTLRMGDVLRRVTVTVHVRWSLRRRLGFRLGLALIRWGARVAGLGGVQVADLAEDGAG